MRLIGTLLLGLLLLAPPALAQGFSPEQRAEIVEILREALRRDPAILREALMAMEEAELRDRTEARRAAIEQNGDALFRDAADPVKGNPQGSLTIVEFFDARCGYCKQLHPAMEALVRRNPDLRVVMKDLPILGPNSVLASRALLAAQRQGRYGPLYDALLTLRGEPTEAVIRQHAERLGLDWARLRRDMDDPAIQRRLEGNIQLARQLGVEGTPALVIGTTLVPGALELEQLERLVAEARMTRR
jgi:protein-disulfide isomerase